MPAWCKILVQKNQLHFQRPSVLFHMENLWFRNLCGVAWVGGGLFLGGMHYMAQAYFNLGTNNPGTNNTGHTCAPCRA